MAFRATFQRTDVATCIQPGIQALGRDSQSIRNEGTSSFEGSVNIDECLAQRYPQDHRWDYAFGLRARIYYVEVHHANDSEVSVVIAKFRWLKDWQNRQPNSAALKTNSSYHWVSSGKVTVTKNSRYTRSLIQAGLEYPVKTLRVE